MPRVLRGRIIEGVFEPAESIDLDGSGYGLRTLAAEALALAAELARATREAPRPAPSRRAAPDPSGPPRASA